MRRAVTRLGLVGLLAGGLVAASAGAAFAKSDVRLTTSHPTVRSGTVVAFIGSADDDAGIHKTLFCLQERVTAHRWVQVGRCVRSHRENTWSAGFRLSTRVVAKGRQDFRAVGLNPATLAERYGPSPVVTVTVR
jgi:hypothetical protein